MTQDITLTPVGRVRNTGSRFNLEIDPAFAPALETLEGFGHIQVLWWAHESDRPKDRAALTVSTPYRNSPGVLGIFATRSETRPNPAMLTTATVIRIDHRAGQVELGWIDAADNSPIIDIKPYQPCFDRVQSPRLPDWCRDWPQSLEDSAAFDWSSVFNFQS